MKKKKQKTKEIHERTQITKQKKYSRCLCAILKVAQRSKYRCYASSSPSHLEKNQIIRFISRTSVRSIAKLFKAGK